MFATGEGNALRCVSNRAEAAERTLSNVLVQTDIAWRAQPFIGSCTMISTPATTTAPSASAIDVQDEAGDGSKTIVTVVSVVGASALAILLGIFYMICRNKNKHDVEESHTKPSGNAVSFDPSENSRNANYYAHSSSGVPAPLAYDYGSSQGVDGHRSGNGQAAVQVANVLSVDGPIADAEPIPHMYFPRADTTAGSSSDPGVRFKDQASEVPSSGALHSGSGVPGSISSFESHGNHPPPYLQQKINRMSAQGGDLGIPNADATDVGESTSPNDNTQQGRRAVPPTQRNAAQPDAQFKDQAQSVIGEVQAVNGQPFYDPGTSTQSQLESVAETDGTSRADPSMIPIESNMSAVDSVEQNDNSKVAEESGEESMLAI